MFLAEVFIVDLKVGDRYISDIDVNIVSHTLIRVGKLYNHKKCTHKITK